VGAEFSCPDHAFGQNAGGISAYVVPQFGPNTSRISAVTAMPSSALSDHVSGQEYFLFRLKIDNMKTVGAGACPGCDVPVCLVMQSIQIKTAVTGNDQLLTNPLNGTDSHYATWQGGGSPVTPRGTGCPAATPTRRSAWGAVKALYR
jgi:hypothetical protein